MDVAALRARTRGLTAGGRAATTSTTPPATTRCDGKAADLLARLGGFDRSTPVPHCCSEAGTLALSRPDITDAMLHRKREALAEALDGQPDRHADAHQLPVLRAGAGAQRPLGVTPQHLVVALAERLSGAGWQERFRAQAAGARAIQF